MAGIYNEVYDNSGNSFRLPSDLNGELDASGKMFEEMRYFYEGGDFAKHWYLSPLPDLLRSLILSWQPNWDKGAALIAKELPIIQDLHSTGETEEIDNQSIPLSQWSFIAYGIPPLSRFP
jgi:hypothetical protein